MSAFFSATPPFDGGSGALRPLTFCCEARESALVRRRLESKRVRAAVACARRSRAFFFVGVARVVANFFGFYGRKDARLGAHSTKKYADGSISGEKMNRLAVSSREAC